MFRRITLLFSLLFCLLGFSQSSFAEMYWGVGGGITNWDIKPLLGTTSVDNGITIDGLFGYREGHFGVEGELSISKNDWANNSDNYTTAANLIGAVLAFIPLSDTFEFYVKGGIDFWSTNVHYSGSNYDGDSGASGVLGLGFGLKFTKSFSMRLEYKQMNNISDGVDSGDIGQTTLLATFNI